MSTEVDTDNLPPDPHARQMEQMQDLWQELPDEHQVALALQFMDTIMSSAYRPYFLHLLAKKWELAVME